MSLHQLEPTCRLPNVSVCSEKLRWSINEVVLDVETLTYTDHLDLARSRNIRLNFQGFFWHHKQSCPGAVPAQKVLEACPFPGPWCVPFRVLGMGLSRHFVQYAQARPCLFLTTFWMRFLTHQPFVGYTHAAIFWVRAVRVMEALRKPQCRYTNSGTAVLQPSSQAVNPF